MVQRFNMSRLSGIGGALVVIALVVFKIWGQDIVHWVASASADSSVTVAPKGVVLPSKGEAKLQQLKLVPIDRARLRRLPVHVEEAPTGRLVFSYEESDNPNDYSAVTFAVNTPLFRSLSNEVYRYLPLEKDLPVVVATCHQANAFWNRETEMIVLCTELFDHFNSLFSGLRDPSARKAAVDGALLFTLTHELGHATEDLLKLKLTGMSESNADQFATLLLLAMGESGLMAIRNAAAWFEATGQAELRGRIAFWDEHGLNLERYVNLLCYLYGKSPFKHAFLVGAGLLPVRRAERCGDEFERMRAGWKSQLDGRLKQPLP
jgi:hypothetical protein